MFVFCCCAQQFNESLLIALSIYNTSFVVCFIVPIIALGLGGRRTTYLIRGFAVIFVAMSTLSLLFVPKLVNLCRVRRRRVLPFVGVPLHLQFRMDTAKTKSSEQRSAAVNVDGDGDDAHRVSLGGSRLPPSLHHRARGSPEARIAHEATDGLGARLQVARQEAWAQHASEQAAAWMSAAECAAAAAAGDAGGVRITVRPVLSPVAAGSAPMSSFLLASAPARGALSPLPSTLDSPAAVPPPPAAETPIAPNPGLREADVHSDSA